MQRARIQSVVFAVICGGLASVALGQVKVEEKTAAPGGRDAHYSVSSTGAHLATAHMQGSRFVATVDGVDGPRVDAVVPVIPSFQPGTNIATDYVLISNDGKHTAYIARKGSDDTLMVDGKALVTVHPGNYPIHLRFTGPGGTHVAMAVRNESSGLLDFWVDGKPQPAFDNHVQPAFSTDGSRWAYVATLDPKNAKTSTELVVDGKYTGYMAQYPQFTADNQHVLSLAQVKDAVAVLVDGETAVKGESIRNVIVGPTGSHYAVILSTHQSDGGNVYQVMLDGKLVPNTNYSDHTAKGKEPIVKFSPDGNHLAVICNEQENTISYVVYDGKKGQSYDHIYKDWFGISPGGSWLAYVAKAGPNLFAITNGTESDAIRDVDTFLFSADGKHVVYHGTVNGAAVIYLDGKAAGRMRMVQPKSLVISRDGSHWAAVDLTNGQLVLDGKVLNGVQLSQSGRTVFSPDGKYVVFNGRVGRINGLFLTDGKKLTRIGSSAGASFITFSPDGKHLFWRQTDRVGGAYKIVTYVDGKATTAMFDNVSNPFTTSPLCWQVDDAGVLTCLGPKDGNVVRFTVTPDASGSFIPKS